MNFAGKYADELTARAFPLMRFEAGVWRPIVENLADVEDAVLTGLKDNDPTETKAPAVQMANVNRLVEKAVAPVASAVYLLAANSTEKSAVELADNESSFVVKAVAVAAGLSLFHKIRKDRAEEFGRRLTAEAVPTRDWWKRQRLSTLRRYQDALRKGVSEGDDLSGLIARVRGDAVRVHGKTTYPNAIIRTSEREARALVETSLSKLENDVRFDTYKANSELVRGVQMMNPLDNKTSPICRARFAGGAPAWTLDGKPFPGTNIPFPGMPPWHWRCRTWPIPILRPHRELVQSGALSQTQHRELLKLSKEKKIALDGKPATVTGFDTFFARRSERWQKSNIGKRKFELWKEKKLSFVEMIDQSGRPLTIEELEAL